MASDWAFEELGPRAFEQLAVALAVKLIGPEVAVYGSGRDGGREATYTGVIEWPEILDKKTGPSQRWTGYTVVQAKQRERVGPPAQDLGWLKGQIRSELDDWAAGGRSKLPDNLLFVTNARLSAEDDAGGVDQINRYIATKLDEHRLDAYGEPAESLRIRGLRNAYVWHRDTLNALVSDQTAIRDAFPALITVGDLLTRLTTLLPGVIDPEQLAPLLVDHAQNTLRHEQWLRFDEAGDTPETRHQIDGAIVDLPAIYDSRRVHSLLSRIIERADQVTRPSVWQSPHPRHLVITGAPGNGKSTVAKYITQVYRAHFARHEANQAGVREIINRTNESLERIEVRSPKSPRWPLRVDLATMASDMGPEGGPGIKRWLATVVTSNTDLAVEPASLTRWMKAWPTLLIFDGFDEVTMPQHRQRIVDEIGSLLDWADSQEADLLMIITTRRTGYTERLLPDHFDQIDLDTFTPQESLLYAQHITAQRLSDDVPHRDHVLAQFGDAIKNPSIERLLKTPLQVLILTIILGGSGSLPTTRYQLFWNYFDTVFRREANKNTANRTFFRDHRTAIIELHQMVGAVLHIRCETTDEVVPKMPRSELSALAAQYMREGGHDEDTATAFAGRIFAVATQRLVLLTADENDTVSFDVRSLQELMAGRRLVDGSDAEIRSNLEITALSPHWRNAWLFAAGKLATDSRHRSEMLIDIVEHCDDANRWPAWLCPAGPELAAYLLDDGLAAERPYDQTRLIDVALRCLQGPFPQEPQTIAAALQIASSRRTLDSQRIRNEIGRALESSGERRAIAQTLVYHGQYGSSRVPGHYTPEDLQRTVDMWKVQLPGPQAKTSIGELIRPVFGDMAGAIDPSDAQLVESAIADLTNLILKRTDHGDLWPVTAIRAGQAPRLDAALDNTEAAELLRVCLGSLPPQEWTAQSMVARLIAATRSRQPVGHLLTIGGLAEQLTTTATRQSWGTGL
ncbi:AAA family ATPase [Gordonia jinghuaiqii]|uniref:Uncharacterized protein n=1 Tax=Gordonia jinghuaiqii TaxID=2758710 RepID=A0A7D7LWH7_9ACTN|nr:hypothetical protein [Gordonia jinghuaiqii]MCR5977484.1 AAA family ATPase [Gordonia jinghuaiqii]QMT02175.1 hypothetical protein H1R19_03065 [Gordonia jinghuaiqii]